MTLDAAHVSPDGILRFVIMRDDDNVSLGFDGYVWHTHSDLLAVSYGVSEQTAVARFVEDLLNDRVIIVVSRVAGSIRDVWVTDDPASELLYKTEEEDIEFRFWSGRPWRANQ
jgi:hypothetical protein